MTPFQGWAAVHWKLVTGRLLSFVRIIPEHFRQSTGADPKELFAPYYQMTAYQEIADCRFHWATRSIVQSLSISVRGIGRPIA